MSRFRPGAVAHQREVHHEFIKRGIADAPARQGKVKPFRVVSDSVGVRSNRPHRQTVGIMPVVVQQIYADSFTLRYQVQVDPGVVSEGVRGELRIAGRQHLAGLRIHDPGVNLVYAVHLVDIAQQ